MFHGLKAFRTFRLLKEGLMKAKGPQTLSRLCGPDVISKPLGFDVAMKPKIETRFSMLGFLFLFRVLFNG